MIVTAKKFNHSAHILLPKDCLGKTYELKEVKPLEDINLVLDALKDNKEAYKTAKKLLLSIN
jgi:hypothetical protein